MPPRKKAVAAETPAEQTADSGDLDAMREEVAAETPTPAADDDTWPRPIPVGDVAVHVKHFLDWPLDSDRHLAVVDITSWARDVVVEDDFVNIWAPAKLTVRQGLAFVKAVEVATGVPFAPHLASLTT